MSAPDEERYTPVILVSRTMAGTYATHSRHIMAAISPKTKVWRTTAASSTSSKQVTVEKAMGKADMR